jgi:hypothetical protein
MSRLIWIKTKLKTFETIELDIIRRDIKFHCQNSDLSQKIAFDLFIFTLFSLHLAKVVSLNPTDDEVYSIQHYVINFVSWWFSLGTSVSCTNKMTAMI